ncbi:FG-GAP-like repeat-containing protein [Microbacterium sp. ARD31]|uniref:FG-GAP-like repeat-containing protein n=1 Tax=Microbacterium sp. ARD31 TaxID=2962576 RepID=UPI00288242C7|nr:FG-GAP-like repeat-containing protein [Microbacterium sp. ARD31]MDT0179762.1 FG-GAP-like repeat-containing protein [Microbacterium sp. ARD31]
MRAPARAMLSIAVAASVVLASVPLSAGTLFEPSATTSSQIGETGADPSPPPAPEESPAPTPDPPTSTPDPAIPTPDLSADPTPAPTASASPESTPGTSPSPSPSPETAPEEDHERDGPTLPLTRDLPPDSSIPVAPLRLTVPQYGPQPVFRLPFAPGIRWGASGSHSDSDGINRGAIDFSPLSSKDRAVRTVAAGTVYRVRCSTGWFLGVDHGGGWMSEYYHLTNAKSSLVGQWVEAGTTIGTAGQTLPCGGTPGDSAHVHLSILNAALDVPSGKRKYVSVSGIQFDNYTLRDSSGAYNGVWRNLQGDVVLTSRRVTCCLTASTRIGPTGGSTLPDTDGNGIDDYSEATTWDTDLNSNGLPDIVAFGGAGVYTAFNNGRTFGSNRLALSNFGTSKGWQRSSHPRMVLDVTGDGRPDVLGFGASGVSVSAGSGGSSFATARKWSSDFGSDKGWRVGVHQRVVADVTGDGRPDVIGFGGAGVYVARNTGSAFASAQLWSRQMGSDGASGGWRASAHPRFVADVTGDGRGDLIGFGARGVYVARNTGSGFAPMQPWVSDFAVSQGWTVVNHPRYVFDIDGDGRADIVGFGANGVQVARGTGSGFAATTRWSGSYGSSASAGSWRGRVHARTFADVNGDGRPDVVAFGTSRTFVALNRGSSFGPSTAWTDDFGSREWTQGWMPRVAVDANGDGRADIVGFARDGVHVALSTGSRFGAATHWTGSFGWDASAGGWRVGSNPRAIGF